MVLRKPALRPAGNPVCSVCVANYNGLETLNACLESIIAQDCGFEFEIIVHDDASTDGGIDRLQERYPGIELLESDENVGFCVSNNRMVKEARGEYILLLNNDATLHADALRSLHECAKKSGSAILGLPQYDMQTGKLIDRGSLLDPFFNPVPNLDAERTTVAMVIGACLWITRSLWNELGGFPEWFGSIAEDMYLCCSARLRGYPVEVLSTSGYRHWSGKSFGGGKIIEGGLHTTRLRRVLSERNKNFVMILCTPTPVLTILLPLHLSILVLEGMLVSILKWDISLWGRIYWNSIMECWRFRRCLLLMRHATQSGRKVPLKYILRVYTWMPYKLGMLLRHGLPRLD